MAEADNSSSEGPRLSQRQAGFNFEVAYRHCYEIIFKGRSVKTVDEIRWAYQTRRWSEIVRPELGEAFAKCELAGMLTGNLRTRIEKLDTEYRLVCELRDGKSRSHARTPTVTWVTAEAKRMKAAREVPQGITEFAQLLEKHMANAAKADRSLKPVTWRHIKNNLPRWGLWP